MCGLDGMKEAWEHVRPSTGSDQKEYNAKPFRAHANLDKYQTAMLSAFLFNEETEDVAIALCILPASSSDDLFSLPCIYSAGHKTDDETWRAMIQDPFPFEPQIDQSIMMCPNVLRVMPFRELNQSSELDMQTTRDLSWAFWVLEILALTFTNSGMPPLSDDEMNKVDMTLIGKVMQFLMMQGVAKIAEQV